MAPTAVVSCAFAVVPFPRFQDKGSNTNLHFHSRSAHFAHYQTKTTTVCPSKSAVQSLSYLLCKSRKAFEKFNIDADLQEKCAMKTIAFQETSFANC